MSETRPDISSIPPLPLEDFLDALRREGFAVEADHYHEVPQLLNTLAPEHTFEALKTLLAPLFVRNRQEQQRFYVFFDRYFAVRPVRPASPSPRPTATEPPSRPMESAPPKEKQSVPTWLYIIVAILLFLGLFFGGYYLFLVLLSGSSLVTAGLIGFILIGLGAFHNVLKRRLKGTNTFWYGIAFITIFVIVLAISLRYLPEKHQENGLIATIVFGILSLPINWYLSRPKKEASRKAAPAIKLVAPLRFAPAVPFPRLSLIGRTEAFHISRHLNRRQTDSYNTREIDIPATLERTLRNAGNIDIAFLQIATQPQYLLLIDAASANEHEVEWFDYLLQVLQGDETRLERYFFEHDPSFCWREREEAAVPFQNLYSGQRLILLSDGYSLADPVTGGLFNWALDLFSLWTEKALLSYRPVDEWGYLEQQLAREFCLAPSTVDGLMEAVAYFDNRSDKSLEEWHRDNIYDVLNTDDIGLIRRNLPTEVFEWLCACALYPELYWKLTLHLGELLEERPNALLNQENLTRLNRLKWFREGQIPEEARMVLIALLSEAATVKARKALAEVLSRPASIPPKGSYAYRQYQLNLLRNQFELAQQAGEARAAHLFRQLQLFVAEQGTTDPELLDFLKDKGRQEQYGLPLDALTDSIGQTSNLLSRKDQSVRLCWAFYRGGEQLRVTDHLEARLEGMENILLLIPGLEDSKQLVDFARAPYLEQEYDAVLTFEYNRMRQGLDESAQVLKKLLSEAGLEQDGQTRLTILAHSTGGLAARYYIEQLEGNRYVEHLVMTGPPNGGARPIDFTNYFWAILEGVFRFLPFFSTSLITWIRRIFNRSFIAYQQIETGSSFLQQLNRKSEEVTFKAANISLSQTSFQAGPYPGIPYSIIAGNAEKFYRDKNLSWFARFAMGLMSSIYDNKPHDMAVTIESTRAIGDNPKPAPAFREVMASHSDYYTEPDSVKTIRALLQRDLTVEEAWQETPPESGSKAPEAEAPVQETTGSEAPEQEAPDKLSLIRNELNGLLASFDTGPTEVINRMREVLQPESPLHGPLEELQERWVDLQKQWLGQVIPEAQFKEQREVIVLELMELIDEKLGVEDLRENVSAETGSSPEAAQQGKLLFRIPPLQVNEEGRLVLRIARTEQALLENFKIDEFTQLRDIRISDVMVVELLESTLQQVFPSKSPSFSFRSLSSPEQFIDKEGYTEWLFLLQPLVKGPQPLQIKISTIEVAAGREQRREQLIEETLQVVAMEAPLDRMANLPSRWALSAGNEIITDGPPRENSPFMGSILSFLRQNEEPRFSISRLSQAVMEMSASNSEQLPQSAPLNDAGHQGGEFIFYAKTYAQSQSQVYQQNAPAQQSSGPETAVRGRAFLFTIAISQYQNTEILPLYKAVRDARELADVLTRKYQFESQNTFILYDIEATRGNIFSTFERLLKEAVPDDEVLIFFSGHGEVNPELGQSYWLPADAQPGRSASYLSSNDIQDFIRSMPARHVLIIADAPFSGRLFK
ncbi:MAG: caspase family protein [Phaeodactylibacter sp.]|nr:caspase family protein [Phaeodactylibacter sp.]